jgi:hypothetical protein
MIHRGVPLHDDRPTKSWNEPAAHGEQASATGAPIEVPKLPTVQLVQVVWPCAVWYDPAGQNVQAVENVDAPVTVPKVPELHSWHDD